MLSKKLKRMMAGMLIGCVCLANGICALAATNYASVGIDIGETYKVSEVVGPSKVCYAHGLTLGDATGSVRYSIFAAFSEVATGDIVNSATLAPNEYAKWQVNRQSNAYYKIALSSGGSSRGIAEIQLKPIPYNRSSLVQQVSQILEEK